MLNDIISNAAREIGPGCFQGYSMTAKTITSEWLRSIGFSDCRPCHVHGTPNQNWYHQDLDLEIWQFNDGPWLWREADSYEMHTQEQLEALMHWLRITNPERPVE